jgi:hypothetical protein
MEKLKEKINAVVVSTMSNKEIVEKCDMLAKEYTLKVLDSLTHNGSGSFNDLYLRISKTRMAVQAGDI